VLDGEDAALVAAKRRQTIALWRADGYVPPRLVALLDECDAVAREHRAAERRAIAAAVARTGSAAGTSEVPELGDVGSGAPQSRELTVDEAIDVIGAIGDRGVRKACKSGRLRGRKHGGAWLIEETSVVEFAKSRRRRSTAA
jgi:hypothetical protein